MPTAAVVVTWEGGATTERCVASLLAQDRPPARVIVVVDNASGAAERERLRARLRGDGRAFACSCSTRTAQFAGGLNAGAAARARGAARQRVLFLNNDTVLAPDAARLLDAALDAAPGAGIAGPRVVDLAAIGADDLSAGERHVARCLCVPRTLLRYRAARLDRPYPRERRHGLRAARDRAPASRPSGGSPTEIEVYYEDVDFCLGAARAAGFGAVIEPRAVVAHDGMRGFAAGLTPWAAFLKARNPWLVVRRRGGPASWLASSCRRTRRWSATSALLLRAARPRRRSCARSRAARLAGRAAPAWRRGRCRSARRRRTG